MTTETTWQDKFKSHGIRIGFRLFLSRPMLESLCALSEGVHWDRAFGCSVAIPDNWLATERALTERGLIERVPTDDREDDPRCPSDESMVRDFYRRLTPAGVALVELLRVGGFFIEAKEAKRRIAAQKGKR